MKGSAVSDQYELDRVREEALFCQRCTLWQTRTQVVFGAGKAGSKIMFVGEAPGEDEDRTGTPFVGRAGILLDQLLEEAGIGRESIYITNIIRCRPTAVTQGKITNRAPRAGEVSACEPWMWLEIHLVKPSVIVCVGAPAAKTLIDKNFRLSDQRGDVYEKEDGIRYIATLHPAYLLRLLSTDTEAYQRAEGLVIQDLKKAKMLASR